MRREGCVCVRGEGVCEGRGCVCVRGEGVCEGRGCVCVGVCMCS